MMPKWLKTENPLNVAVQLFPFPFLNAVLNKSNHLGG